MNLFENHVILNKGATKGFSLNGVVKNIRPCEMNKVTG